MEQRVQQLEAEKIALLRAADVREGGVVRAERKSGGRSQVSAAFIILHSCMM